MAMQEPSRTKGFPCKYCGSVCANMPSLLEHMDSHFELDEDRKFKCEECGRGYRHAGSLANHKKTHEVGSFQCQICSRNLSNALALKSHLRSHTSQKKYSCMDCGKAFRLATQLATHQRVHLSRQSQGRPTRRSATLESSEDVEDNDSHHFDEQPGSVLSDQQEMRFDSESENSPSKEEEAGGVPNPGSESDKLDSEETGDRPFKCDQCDKTYRHHGSLINHRKSHSVGIFECPICFKQLNNLAALHSHQRIHNKTRSGPGGDNSSMEVAYSDATPEQFSPQNRDAPPVHFCHLCQVLYPNDEEFQEHIQMHNSSSMSFGLHEGLAEDHNVSYDRSVTQSPNSSFYASPLNHTPSMPSLMDNHGDFDHSQEQFNNSQIYSDHSSSETPSTFNTQGEQSIIDPDILDSALNQTDSGDDMTKAEEASDGERRFRCQICGKSYRHAGSLINHKRSHQTGIYQCSICRKSYPHLAALRSHLRIHKAQPSSFSLSNEGDWLSSEPLTLENHQQGGASGFSSPEGGDSGSMMGFAQENTGGDICGGEHSNGASFHDGQFESTFAQDRTVHLPHDEHLMENHMCADCGETFADIAGIKSHMCPLLQQQQQQQHLPLSNGYNNNIDFQGANGMIGNPEDHMEFQGLNSNPDQRYYAEHSFHESMNGEPLNGEEEEEEEDDGGGDDNEEDDDDGELYQCSVCGNRYTNMRALRSHLRGHTQSHGTPPSSGPSSLSSLEEEKEEDLAGERQKGDGGGLIICSTCGESFTKKQDMMAHQLLHNKAQVIDDDNAGQLDMGSSSNGTWHKEEAESIICGKCGIFCSSFHHLETHGCSTERKFDAPEYNKKEEEDEEEEEEKADTGEIGNGKELKYMKENVDNGDRQYVCDQCGRAYRHAGSLLNHKKSHKTGVFRCFVCQKRFYNLLALKNHQRTHFDVKRHTCTECGKAFKIQKQLQNHLRIHKENQAKIQELNDQIQALMQMNGMGSEGSGTQPLTPNANQASTSRSRRRRQPPKPTLVAEKVCQTEIQAGVKLEDNGDPRPYSCDQCGRTYRHAGSLVNHKNSHKTGEYYCSVCNNTYSNQLAMKNHLRIHFALKKHSCQECGRAFRGKKQLASHVCRKEVKGGAPRGRGRRRAIKCKECGQAFSSADQLTAHTCDGRSNPGGGKAGGASLKKEERPFTCSICNRSYRHAGSLLNHKNTHMTGHFSCTFCSKPFSNPMALRNHTRIHTQKKKHVCLTCGKAFRLSSILHNHQKVHTRVASHFSCPACGKSFQGKSGLKRHRCQKRTENSACRAGGGGGGGAGGAGAGSGGGGGHHSEGGGDKCFMCDLCGRSYRHAGSLLNHKKTHSENLHHCTLCLQTFPDPMTLQIHSQMKRHCCPECGKTFCLVAHLQSHMEVHNSKDRTLVCSPCHQSFPNTATYQQHQDLQHRAHPELHHRPHQDLHHRALPELHPRPHQDLHHRPQGHYQHQDMSGSGHMQDGLGWGSEGLDQTMGLQGMPKLVPAFAHMHSGMPDPQLDPQQQDGTEAQGAGGDEEKSHTCEHCGRTYRHAGSLLNHKNSHKTGSFFCSVCQKEFTNLMALKNHRRIHTEPKRYQCLECGKAFRVSTQLICHRRIHTKEKPFSCLLCDKRFSSKSNLRHHQKMHQQSAQAYDSSFSMEAANAFLDLDMGSFL